ncbi:hypothetical protein C9I98_18375 [Photobacterium sanctipauli]|uniref:PA domain-containing protein n=1 Tax=Photobacterium sanctipauli TaxID=1342794 RepID=A0A2T3NP69_9GAMM|nr:PA domain-containing protein [Photobacterium sanctipauli]PSW18059.1 hypothetical protein C9I98_18375 [Photobacterium sanctipauli]
MNHSESRRLFLKAVGAGVGTAAVGLLFAANALDSKNANFFYQESNASKGHELLSQLTEKFEHRLCGSKNAFEAEQFCHDKFTAMGFTDVRFEPFVKDVWNRGHLSKMDIIANNGQSYSVNMVAFGGSPSPVDVKAEVVDLADAMEEDYQSIDVKGKIVIGNIGMDDGSKAPHRSVKVALALKKGAAGIILHNNVKHNTLLTGGAGRYLPIPAASVGFEDGMDIRNKLKTQKLYAHIRMDGNHYVNATHRNVVAVLPGSEKPE